MRARLVTELNEHPRASDESVSLEQVAAAWSLVVRSVNGAVALQRELPAPPPPGTDCAAFATMTALMLRRYLEEIRLPSGREASALDLGPAPTPEFAPPAESVPVEQRSAFALHVGPEFGTAGVGAVFGAGLLGKYLRIGVEALGRLPMDVPLTGRESAAFSLVSGGARLRVGRAIALGPVHCVPALVFGADVTRAAVDGDRIYQRTPAWAVHPSAGLSVGGELMLSPNDVLTLRGDLLGSFGRTRFGVHGESGGVTTSLVTVTAALLWGRAFGR